MNSLVSIIIPVFNSSQFINKCLDSVIHQTYPYLEIILINDGSTDSSPKIIDGYASKDSRIVAIHKENGGIGSAYKAAFEVMTGDYVLFVDSDDWLELNAVEALVKLAMENNADMVSFGIMAFNRNGQEVNLPSFKNIDLINITNEAILKTHFEVLKHPTLVRLYKRDLFKDIVVFEQNIGIDEMLTPQLLAKCNRAVYTSEVYYNVLIRQDSACRVKYDERKITQTLNIFSFLIQFLDNNIPNYTNIILLKHLRNLASFKRLALSEKFSATLNNRISNKLSSAYIRAKSTSQFKSIDFKNRLLIWFLVNKPQMLRLLILLKNRK